MREKFWEIKGTKMGDVINQASTKQVAQKAATEPEKVDYRLDNQYQNSLKKTEAVSDFARTKTLKEQREFLPIFTVRDELLTVIRDNRIVVIVGETGSGKTT